MLPRSAPRPRARLTWVVSVTHGINSLKLRRNQSRLTFGLFGLFVLQTLCSNLDPKSSRTFGLLVSNLGTKVLHTAYPRTLHLSNSRLFRPGCVRETVAVKEFARGICSGRKVSLETRIETPPLRYWLIASDTCPRSVGH